MTTEGSFSIHPEPFRSQEVFSPKPRCVWKLFLASYAALYFELVIIRYLSTEVRAFAYLKNLPLIASFFGIGLGMILGTRNQRLQRLFPFLALGLFAVIAFAQGLNLTHLPFPQGDNYVWGSFPSPSKMLLPLQFVLPVVSILMLLVGFFTVLGGIVGEQLTPFDPLTGYGINLAGSVAGIVVFSLEAFLSLPPVVWTLLGFLSLVPFFLQKRAVLVWFLLATVVTFRYAPQTYWSPYYRIDVQLSPIPSGWASTPAYLLRVNHDFHQHILDLSDEFLARYPGVEPNRMAVLSYQLPYLVVPHPKQVLVVGAGTGNDVASALRHGADHVDAVEIDPVVLKLGKQYHPERPYDSPRVTVYNDDARAYFKKTSKTYDLIVFGFLDSHTLLSGLSSVRLDNFVYTRESFQEADRLLRSNGAMVLAFGTGRSSFVNQRMYNTLADGLQTAPQAYSNGYIGGVSFVITKTRSPTFLQGVEEITPQFVSRARDHLVATDHWPFLYLASRSVPISILLTLGVFLLGAFYLVKTTVSLPRLAGAESLHFFFLGAGFLLLETKAVTELSLLFGSTWIVNAVVIAAFLTMALTANALAMVRPVSTAVAYTALFVLLAVSLLLPYSVFSGWTPLLKFLAVAMIVGLPIFFSGMIFSQSFRGTGCPAQGLGVNLLGAVVGGTLENIVMIGGTLSLGVLAIVFYGLSAIFRVRREKLV